MKIFRMSWSLVVLAVLLFASARASVAGQGNISGLILNANGLSPVADLLVVLENEAGSHSTTTDENGSYFIRDLPAGDYQIHVSGDQYRTLTRDVTLSPNETAIVNLAAISEDILDMDSSGIRYPGEKTTVVQTWKGKWTETRPDPGLTGTMTWVTRVSGNTLTGTVTVRNTHNGTLKFPCTGTIEGRKVKIAGRVDSTKFRATGTLNRSRTKMTGSYQVYNNRVNTGSGTFKLTKR